MTKATEQIAAEDVISIDEARALLNQEAQDRVRQCTQAINVVLEQYQCQIGSQAELTRDGRVTTRIVISPRQ